MKPGQMPPRSAPMSSGKALQRGKRLKPMSDKRRAALPERAEVRERVIVRDGGCLLRGHTREWGPCMGRPTFHHLQKESQGGTYTDDNGVCLCVRHNEDQETARRSSEAWGLTVDRNIDHAEAARRRATWAPTPRGATA